MNHCYNENATESRFFRRIYKKEGRGKQINSETKERKNVFKYKSFLPSGFEMKTALIAKSNLYEQVMIFKFYFTMNKMWAKTFSLLRHLKFTNDNMHCSPGHLTWYNGEQVELFIQR